VIEVDDRFAKLVYDDVLMKRAAAAYWRRTVGTFFWITIATLTACLWWLWFVRREMATTLLVIGAGVVGFEVLCAAAIYFINRRLLLDSLPMLTGAPATLRAEAESFTVLTAVGETKARWSEVKEIARHRDFWFVFVSKTPCLTLPTAGLSTAMQDFFLGQVAASGGKVR
jgi:hypothetical protein